MKKFKLALGFLLLLSFLPFNVLAQGSEPPIPPAPIDGSVVLDTLNWLSSAQEAEINSINKKLDDDGIAQMAVVTLDDCGGDKVKFRNDLFRAWGIGHKNDNDGLLIMVCWYGGDPSRRSVEQTTGLGMEGFLPDELTSKIAKRLFIPSFQENRPGEGLVAMVKEYAGILRQDTQNSPAAQTYKPTHAYLAVGALGVIPGLFFATLYVNILRSRNKLVTKVKKGRKRISYKNEFMGVIIPGAGQITVAEILSLIPILGVLSFNQESIYSLLPAAQEYGDPILKYLLPWFLLLIGFFISPYFPQQKEDGRSFRDYWWHSSGDNSGGGDGFGGGDSGGGGSSTGF